MLEIRRYVSSDYEDVWNLHVSGFQKVGAYLGDGPWDNDLHSIEDVYLHNRGEFLIGVYDGRIAAMGAFRKTTTELAEIKRMRVHSDFQGRGFGQMILDELETRALALGSASMRPTCASSTPGLRSVFFSAAASSSSSGVLLHKK